MSKANPLKKRLKELEAEVASCEDPTEREHLKQRAVRLRNDLEQAGYLSPLAKPSKTSKNRRPNQSKTPQNVDPLVRAKNRPGFAGGKIRFVQGGSARGK